MEAWGRQYGIILLYLLLEHKEELKVLVVVQCCLVKVALNTVKVLVAIDSILGPGGGS